LSESDPPDSHFEDVAKAILQREVIPFLGAGASLCDRGRAPWKPLQSQFLPSSNELTDFLAREYNYPSEESKELTRVAQYAVVKKGLAPLYNTLQDIFDKDYKPTTLHRFLARLPSRLRENGQKRPGHPVRERLILVTTNYDDLLERAFDDEHEPYHKLVYMANEVGMGESLVPQGSFIHWTPDGETSLIEKANEYTGIEDYERSQPPELRHPVIVKIHGAVDRIPSSDPMDPSPVNPSYVITEDHYIDYLTARAEISSFLPRSVVATLKKSHYLFLGYSLRDWNLRVMLRRIWREQKLGYKSWAVQKRVGPLDKEYWLDKGVNIMDIDLRKYTGKLATYL
jgi:hypothetical protein